MFYDKRHSPEAQEWHFRLMNDPKQFEKERYIDTINVYRSIILSALITRSIEG